MKRANNQKDISIINQARVLKNICVNDGITRTEIAKNIGLTSMTITNIVNKLINEGIVKELSEVVVDTKSGRKPIKLDVSKTSPCVLGISISRHHIRLLIADFKNTPIEQRIIKIVEFSDKEEFLKALIDNSKEIIESANRRVIGIGISSIGPLDTSTGTIIALSEFTFLHNIQILEYLKAAFDIPIIALNDASASAIAEMHYGAAMCEDNFLMFRVNYGVGSGIILDGKLYEGIKGMSGEIGHMCMNVDGPLCVCGNRGCLENYIDTNAFAKRINEQYGFDPPLKWEDIVALYNTKQQLFRKEFDNFCKYISYAIVNIINIFDIYTVVLEYAGQDNGDAIEKKVEEYVNKIILANEFRTIKVVQSKMKKKSVLLGTVSHVLEKVFSGEIDYIEHKE